MYKKAILSVFSGCLLLSNSAEAQLTLGIAAGGGIDSFEISKRKVDVHGIADPELHKFNYKGKGFMYGAFLGYVENYNKDFVEFQLGGYRDEYESKNNGSKKDILSSTGNEDTNESLKRDNTFEFAVKLGTRLTNNMNAYGKIGGLYTKFNQKFMEVSTSQSGRVKKLAWGGVIGLGVEKEFKSFNIGLAYAYHYYPIFKTSIQWGSFNNTYKVRPRYHNLYVTMSKTF